MSAEPAILEAAPRCVSIEVLGTPAPKGSARALLVGGRALNVASGSDANKRGLRSWDVAVRAAAWDAHAASPATSTPIFVGVPLHVAIAFRMRRPAGHWGKRGILPSKPRFPSTKPDIDKLARATLDSLTGSVFDDDARIVALTVTKSWADPGREGASITVEAIS